MQRGLRRVGGLVLLALVLPVFGADDKKDDKKSPASPQEKTDEKKADDKKKDDKKSAAPAKTPPPRGKPKYTQTVRAKIGKLDNAPRYSFIVREPYLNNEGKLDSRDKEIEVTAADDLIVRTSILPARFDDKGNPIRKAYTSAELKKLAGPDKSLPGYTADVDSLKSGQVVDIYLGPKKNAAKTEPPVVLMIHILAEPPA